MIVNGDDGDEGKAVRLIASVQRKERTSKGMGRVRSLCAHLGKDYRRSIHRSPRKASCSDRPALVTFDVGFEPTKFVKSPWKLDLHFYWDLPRRIHRDAREVGGMPMSEMVRYRPASATRHDECHR